MALLHEDLTNAILGAAFAVQRSLGPGFIEKFYEQALAMEFEWHTQTE